MLIWLGKQHLEQRDKNLHEHSGPNGKPIEHKNLTEIPDDQLEAKIQALAAKHAPKEST